MPLPDDIELLVERLEMLIGQAAQAAHSKDSSSALVLLQEALDTTRQFNEKSDDASSLRC
jgi:hypothetical protein